jgi:hypothetical protein
MLKNIKSVCVPLGGFSTAAQHFKQFRRATLASKRYQNFGLF